MHLACHGQVSRHLWKPSQNVYEQKMKKIFVPNWSVKHFRTVENPVFWTADADAFMNLKLFQSLQQSHTQEQTCRYRMVKTILLYIEAGLFATKTNTDQASKQKGSGRTSWCLVVNWLHAHWSVYCPQYILRLNDDEAQLDIEVTESDKEQECSTQVNNSREQDKQVPNCNYCVNLSQQGFTPYKQKSLHCFIYRIRVNWFPTSISPVCCNTEVV